MTKSNEYYWFKIGQEYTDTKKETIKAINQLEWQKIDKSVTVAMGPGIAIKEIVKEFHIPKVSHIATNGFLNGLAMYGIRGHYVNGIYNIIMFDAGVMIIPIVAIKIENMDD